MTEDRKARTRLKQDDTTPSDGQTRKDSGQEDEARNENDEAHTELVPPGEGPRRRAKVLPREIRDDDEAGDGDDDLFNDMPV